MKRFTKLLENALAFLAVLTFLALTVVVFLQVLTRYVFHNPLLWSEEVARFLLLWVVMLGAALSVQNEKHFVIELFKPERLKNRRLRSVVEAVPHACVLLFGLVMTLAGGPYSWMGRLRTGTNSQVNMGLVYIAIPIAGAAIIVYSTAHLMTALRSRDNGDAAVPAQGDADAGSSL